MHASRHRPSRPQSRYYKPARGVSFFSNRLNHQATEIVSVSRRTIDIGVFISLCQEWCSVRAAIHDRIIPQVGPHDVPIFIAGDEVVLRSTIGTTDDHTVFSDVFLEVSATKVRTSIHTLVNIMNPRHDTTYAVGVNRLGRQGDQQCQSTSRESISKLLSCTHRFPTF